METRQRATVQRDAVSRVSEPQELGPGHRASAAASSTHSTSRDSAEGSKRGSLSKDAIARRGAKVTKAFSIASAVTRIADDSESDDEQSDANEDDARQNMIAGAPDLGRAADELMDRMSFGVHDDKRFRAMLNVKTRAFIHHREDCLQPDAVINPFIDWSWLEGWNDTDGLQESDINIFARANLVTALLLIERARADGGSGRLELLENLDTVVPALLAPPGWGRPPAILTVNVRACYTVELLLAKATSPADLRQVIASVFCGSTSHASFDHLITNGPFRSLGSPGEDDDSELCSTTAYTLYIRGRQKSGLSALRGVFSLDETLSELEQWIRDEYARLRAASRNADEDAGSDPESQPIIRAGEKDQETSLFVNTQSVRQLAAAESFRDAPPSNQQHPASRNSRISPRYTRSAPFSLNLELLRTATPSIRPAVEPARAGTKRAADFIVDDDEEEQDQDGDVFETDIRPVDDSRRAAIHSDRLGKRARTPQPSHPQRGWAMPSPSRPAPSYTASTAPFSTQQTRVNPSGARAGPSSSAPTGNRLLQADLDALREKKDRVLARARTQEGGYRSGPQMRMPWSANDIDLLVNLIAKTGASWSKIEKKYNDIFEHPRNQQAYRDKARNHKVDLLLADNVLPAGFDLVVLGYKETQKVIQAGKNPMRKESDLNENFLPINTELR